MTVRQISKGVSISIDLLCELLTEVKAEVKGDIWTLPVKQQTGLFANINAALEEQIKRLTQPDLDPETMNLETMRTRSLTSISEQFIKQGQVVIEATKLGIEYGGNRVDSGLLTIGGSYVKK